MGGCDCANEVTKTLHDPPQVLTLLLAWGQDVGPEEIGQTMHLITSTLNIRDIYGPAHVHGRAPAAYRLTGMICYYGQHYYALIHNDEMNAWVMFDDSSITTVGTWDAVCAKFKAGRIQPSVLFYTSNFD